jgi:hypothetical protein
MPHDPFIGETMWRRIDHELSAIEQDHDVRILLAIESGSRAWRFPSQDSDYDVRFIYAHPPDAYLSIEPPRDVIDRPSDGELDINGWDIRKALQLLVRSNAVLLEWLTSPVRYRDEAGISARVLALAREKCHAPALAYHYARLARHSFDEIRSPRSGAALAATTRRAAANGLANFARRRRRCRRCAARHELVERKAAVAERGSAARIPLLDAFIAETLIEPVDRFSLPDRTSVLVQADELFASIVFPARRKPSPTTRR